MERCGWLGNGCLKGPITFLKSESSKHHQHLKSKNRVPNRSPFRLELTHS